MYQMKYFSTPKELVSFLNNNNIEKENIIYIGDDGCLLIYIA